MRGSGEHLHKMTQGQARTSLRHVQGPEIAIHHPDAVLASMNDWCIKHHGDSGLTQLCRESQTTLLSAQSQVSMLFVECAV